MGEKPGSFAALLRSKGITSWTTLKAEFPDVWRMAMRLERTPEKVAPNALHVEPLARALHLPLAEVQSFAKGPPLSQAQLDRVAKRAAHPGGYGRSNFKSEIKNEPVAHHRKPAAATRRTGGHHGKPFLPKRGSFGALMQSQGVPSWPQLEERIGSVAGMHVAKALQRAPHLVARNNPALQLIADALKVPLATIEAFARGKKLGETRIKAIQTRLTANAKKAKKEKSVVLATVHVSGGRAIQRVEDPDGNGHAKRKGRPIGAKTNKLRRADREVREIVRTFYGTYNFMVLNGEVTFPPVPLEQMGVFLREFLDAKGMAADLMLNPNFKDAFDV